MDYTADMVFLKNMSLIRCVREQSYAAFSRFARRTRLLSDYECGCLIEDAVDEERISEAEAEEVKWAEVIVWGQERKERTDLYLVVEIAWTLTESHVTRALIRAPLFQKVTGIKTIPVVLGKVIPGHMRTQAIAAGVDWVIWPK